MVLNCAAAHARWRRNEWENILFTYEYKVILHVYRRNWERFNDACVREVGRWGRAFIMILAGISFRGKTELVFLDKGAGRGGRQRASGGFKAECSR